MKARWRRAVPTPQACDIRVRQVSARSRCKRPTPNGQRLMLNCRAAVKRSISVCKSHRRLRQSRSSRRSRRCLPAREALRERLRRVNRATRADRQNLQHDSEANTGCDPATCETAGVNHDERERQTCFADSDPMKQAHHFFARPKETLRLSENIFQQHAVIEPSPKEDEDECRDECDDEPFHQLESKSSWVSLA